jgi:F0F1-type ATP synthase assembly protein I
LFWHVLMTQPWGLAAITIIGNGIAVFSRMADWLATISGQ